MFLLQVQHQILYQLGQITPRWSTIRLKHTKSYAKPSSSSIQTSDGDQLCQCSFTETLHNFHASPNANILELSPASISNRDFAMRSQFDQTNRAITRLENMLKCEGPAICSVSAQKSQMINHIVASSKLFQHLRQTTPHNSVQHRGFKTHRSVDSQPKNEPERSVLKNLLSSLSRSDSAKVDKIGSEKLKALLNQSGNGKGSPQNQKQNIKIAFAEGYIAATPNERAQITTDLQKVMKALWSLTMFGIFAVLTVYTFLTISKGASVFKMSFSGPSEIDPEDINVSFKDVKGCDEAKQELLEVVEFLKNPTKFSHLGGKLPKGVLLVGPPGTGKTLLARAVAGEASVPFFHAAGAEFDEVLVGQGARRVRDLFAAAKQRAPCVIFIDEIDSVGGKRTNSVLHPYANQTINQLLSEMDGFLQNEGVIVLGATNRRNDLDKALLRPGRFDVEVMVPIPDFLGRQQIIELYLQKVLHKNVDIQKIASGTTGFTGADIENMINQAALRAAIDGADAVSMKYLEYARDKILMGPERKSRVLDDETNQITAYHEAGHALVGHYTKDAHPLHKVTIIPRGASLGHTAYLPEKEQYLQTKSQLLAMMDTAMGGRAAEELIFGPDKVTTGAGDDLKRASRIAQSMVKDLGMSEKFGLRTIEEKEGVCTQNPLGPQTTETMDAEIKKMMNDSYERAKTILQTHAKEHKALAEALLKYETLDADDIKTILSGDKKSSKL